MSEILKFLAVALFIGAILPIVLVGVVNALYGHFFEDFDE